MSILTSPNMNLHPAPTYRTTVIYVAVLPKVNWCFKLCTPDEVVIRDVILRKIAIQNQTDTNEMVTTETKYQTYFYSSEKYHYLTKF